MGTCRFHRVRKSTTLTFPKDQPIHYQFHRVFLIFLTGDLLIQVIQNAIHLHPDKAVECIGNYDDYLEKKKSAPAAEKPKQKNTGRGGEYRMKKEQEAMLRKKRSRLQKLEEAIAAAEDSVSALESQYADPEIAADYEQMLQLNEQVAQVKASLDGLYSEWMSLNEELSGDE